MIRGEYGSGPGQSRGAGGHAVRNVVWVVGIAALGVLIAYKFLPWSKGEKASTDMSGTGSQVAGREAGGSQRDKGVAGQYAEGQRAWPQTPSGGQFPAARSMGGSTERSPRAFQWGRGTGRSQPAPSYADAHQLMAELAQIKPRGAKFTQEEMNEINRLIQEIRRQGRMGVIAIREFLESGQNVSFANYEGKTPLPYSSLRLAMIDTLGQMGGAEAITFMTGMLQTTTNPEEMAFLARGLELSAPGAYRAEILNTVRTMLDQALKTPPGQYQGLGHLFGVIQDYGDASLAADLENMYRRSPSTFTEFSLLALSKIPEGQGMPTLIKIANEMSGDPGSYGMTYDIALRVLTQASREYPEAAEALLKLAKTNKIGTTGLIQVANALGGTEHQLIPKSSVTSRVSVAETQISLKAPETWSNAEIDQRLAMIDELLASRPQPAAAKALEEARNRLLVWKQRPIVGGVRKKQ